MTVAPALPKKDLFELPAGVIYLDGNSLGALPKGALQRAQTVIGEEWGGNLIRAWNADDWILLPKRVGDRVARLIGAPASSVTTGDTLFTMRQKTLSRYCDPTGSAFDPRDFEMTNDVAYALFCEMLDWPFEQMHPSSGVLSMATQVVFKAPSHHGDHVDLNLTIKAIGIPSMDLHIRANANGETRFLTDHTDETGRPRGWPDAVRKKVGKMTEGAA